MHDMPHPGAGCLLHPDQADAAMKLREADRELSGVARPGSKQSPGALYAERWRLRDILDRMNFAAGDMIDPESPSGPRGISWSWLDTQRARSRPMSCFGRLYSPKTPNRYTRRTQGAGKSDRLLGEIIAIRAGFCE